MKLDIKKWNPWNWFKHEDKEEEKSVPVKQVSETRSREYLPSTLMNDSLLNVHREIDRIFEDAFLRPRFGLSRLYERPRHLGLIDGGLLKPNVDIKENKKNDIIFYRIRNRLYR